MTDDTADRADQHNVGYERIVLGSMMSTPDAVKKVTEHITVEDFFMPRHQTLFTAILDAHSAGVPIEPEAIGGYLANQGSLARVGGLPYLFELREAVPLAAQVGWYADELREMADRREVVRGVAQIGQAAASGADADSLYEMAKTIVSKAAPRGGSGLGMVSLGQFIETGVADLQQRRNRRAALATGFYDLDDVFAGGLRPGELMIIAARPAVGKSTLALDISRFATIRRGLTVAFFSLEMTMQDLFDRALAAEANISYDHVRRGELTEDEWALATAALGPMSEARLWVDETRGQTFTQIANKARKVRAHHGLDLVIVDYLQLVKTGRRGQSREQEVSEVARSLKELAGELACPLIAVCQLNRGPENRPDKVPHLADLRESGEIEQAADIVLMLHREDKADPESPRAGECDLIVRKNRAGREDTITVASQLHRARFVPMALEP